jgi:hypothetical protein
MSKKAQLGKKSLHKRTDRANAQVAVIEKRFPKIRRVTQHRYLKPWVATIFIALEVVGFALLVIVGAPILRALLEPLLSYVPDVPIENLLPVLNISFPEILLPTWLEELIKVANKLAPVFIAALIAAAAVVRSKRNEKP